MKKQALLIFFLLAFIGAKAADPVQVSDLNAFKEAVKNNSNIQLTADIDVTDMGTIDVTFSGTIDGKGTSNGKDIFYSLHGGPLDETGDHRAKNPLFKALNGARLQNLVIRNFRLDWNSDDIGAVAKTAKNSYFNNVIVSEVSVFNNDDEAGAIVGKAENCDFRNVRGMGNDVTVDGNRAGGFVGLSINSIYCNCSNSAMSMVYADGSWGNAYAGGFVGESKSDQFVFCVNFASVGALDDRIGGIVGYSAKSSFTNCSNSGYIMHCEEKDFLNFTANIKNYFKANLKSILADLEKQYGHQEFDLTAGFASFFGTLGLSAVSFGVELGLLSFVTCGAAFTVTIIIAATGIVVTLINLIDAEIGAHDEMGGICGACEETVFDCCANYGTLLCRDSYVGGIVGLMREMISKNQISNCLNAGKIQGFEYVGGIFGQGNASDRVNKCLNVGEVIRESSDGKTDPIGSIANASEQTMSYNYYLADNYNENATMRIPVTAGQLKDGTVANWLNDGATSVNAPWHQTANVDDYPVPDPSHEAVNPQKHDDVFAISSLEDLIAFKNAVNSSTKDTYVVYLENDIDCSGITWEPIGTYDHPFAGFCYGNGHTITNLNTAKDTSKNGLGFFGVVGLNTEVRDLFIGSGSITGGNSIGGIIGYAEHRNEQEGFIRIIGCGNAATINGDYDCGGIIGAIYSNKLMQLKLDNCYNMGNVNANSAKQQSAALCGFAKKNALVTSCWNTGAVTGYKSGMGFVRGDADAAPTICNCYVAEGLEYLKQKNVDGTDGVECFTQEEAKNGTLCFKLNGGSNDTNVGLNWEQDISAENNDYPQYKGYSEERKAIYTSRNIANEYGTVVLPYTVTSNDNIQYYTLNEATTGDDAKISFSPVDVLPAGTPAIFHVAESGTYEFLSTDPEFSNELNPITVGNWTMKGNLNLNGTSIVFTDTEELKSLYYISGDLLKSATNKLTVSPFRAYLEGPSRKSNEAKSFEILFDDEAIYTSIQSESVESHNNTVKYGIFNLAGQRLNAPQKGINIINGKKYIQY